MLSLNPGKMNSSILNFQKSKLIYYKAFKGIIEVNSSNFHFDTLLFHYYLINSYVIKLILKQSS